MYKTTIFVLILIVGSFIGNEFVRESIDLIWFIIWGAFILFLIIYYWLDHKGMFVPKKKDKEG